MFNPSIYLAIGFAFGLFLSLVFFRTPNEKEKYRIIQRHRPVGGSKYEKWYFVEFKHDGSWWPALDHMHVPLFSCHLSKAEEELREYKSCPSDKVIKVYTDKEV